MRFLAGGDKATFLPGGVVPIYPYNVEECFLALSKQNIIKPFDVFQCDRWTWRTLNSIFSMVNAGQYLFMYLRAIFKSFSGSPQLSFAHISIRLWSFFILICQCSLSIKDVSPLPAVWVVNNISLAYQSYLDLIYGVFFFFLSAGFLNCKIKFMKNSAPSQACLL